jgi:hypothetical protein
LRASGGFLLKDTQRSLNRLYSIALEEMYILLKDQVFRTTALANPENPLD